jgi:CheY-like chemotaxis protein
MNPQRQVLLIDDDVAVTDYLRLKLAPRYRVVALNDPLRAVETARRERPDIVVCDLDMPGLDGRAVARALAAEPQLRGIAFVHLTSTVAPSGLDAGGGVVEGRPCISKHAPIDRILRRIDEVLRAVAR